MEWLFILRHALFVMAVSNKIWTKFIAQTKTWKRNNQNFSYLIRSVKIIVIKIKKKRNRSKINIVTIPGNIFLFGAVHTKCASHKLRRSFIIPLSFTHSSCSYSLLTGSIHWGLYVLDKKQIRNLLCYEIIVKSFKVIKMLRNFININKSNLKFLHIIKTT